MELSGIVLESPDTRELARFYQRLLVHEKKQNGRAPGRPGTGMAGMAWQVAGTVDRVGDDGAYVRDTRYLNARITADGRDGWPVEPGRYRLAVARACPWANRAIIVRRLLGLENAISMAHGGPRA